MQGNDTVSEKENGVDRKVVSRMAKGKFQEWLTPEGLLKIEGWARDGLIDEQIAKNMGISRSTLNIRTYRTP